MAGLFDPQTLGLLTGAATALEASGPSRTPVSLGQITARGLLGGLNAYGDAQNSELKRGLLGAQMEHLKTQDEATKQKTLLDAQSKEALRKYIAGFGGARQGQPAGLLTPGGGDLSANAPYTPGTMQAFGMPPQEFPRPRSQSAPMNAPMDGGRGQINPMDLLPLAGAGVNIEPFLKIREASQPKRQVSPSGYVYDPATVQENQFLPTFRTEDLGGNVNRYRTNPDGSESLVSSSSKTAAPASLPFWLRRDAQGQSSIDPVAYSGQQGISKAGATRVNVDNRQENEFGKKVGGELGEMYSGLLKADMNAPSNIAKYQRLGNLLGQVNTGRFKGNAVELKAAAKSMGFDLNALGVGDDVAPAQAARALSNQLALELRNPAGGAGMPGAMSDSDREFLVAMVPGLENDPAAIPTMIDFRTRLAKREQQVAKMAREYRKANGRFDEGFFDQLAQWSDRTPLFPESQQAKPAVTKPARTRAGGGWSMERAD